MNCSVRRMLVSQCLLANIVAIHSFVFPIISSSISSITSWGFIKIIWDAVCGPIGKSSSRVVGSNDFLPFNLSHHALHFRSGMDANTSSGSAPFSIICLLALHAQNILSITLPYVSGMSVTPLFSSHSNSNTSCLKYAW